MSTLRTFSFLVILVWLQILVAAPAHSQNSVKKNSGLTLKKRQTPALSEKKETTQELPLKASPSAMETPPLEALATEPTQTSVESAPKVRKGFGLDLNSFFYGPGIAPNSPADVNPFYDGQPSDKGLYFFNLVSMKWRFSERFAFDVQFRNQITITNLDKVRGNPAQISLLGGPQVGALEHQGQRLGISGKLLKGENWSISGAINTDIPLEIGGTKLQGQINSERKLLFNPGAFAFWSYTPPGTRWSGFALLSPRFFIYSDDSALSRQDLARTVPLAAKPRYFIFLNPSINYAVNERVGIRFGGTIDYSNMFAWSGPQRNYAPFELGVTYDVTPTISIYPYILGSSPIDDYLRKEQGAGSIDWRQTWSFNIWLSGSLF